MQKVLLHFRILAKFISWFLFIALVPLAIATYISYNSSREVLEAEVMNSLLSVADNKANRVEVYLREKKRNVTTLSHMSDIIDAVLKFNKAVEQGGINSLEYNAVEEEFRPFLTYYQKSFGYENLFLVNADGDMIFAGKGRNRIKSLYEMALYEESELAKVFINITKSLTTEISDFEYNPETKKAAVFIAAPVFERADLIGGIILEMNNLEVGELVQDYSNLGETGETIIASIIGDKAAFITPLRFDPDAAFNRMIDIGSGKEPDIQKAVQGENGSGISRDYRGQEVLTVWKYIPSFRWGLVVKMDIVEVFASANRLRNTLLKVSLALLMLVVVMAMFIARSISSPIKELTRVSGKIAGGDLSARVKIQANDEIGELAHSFNKMTDSLVEAKANVEEQKYMLEKVNKELDSFVYTASHDLQAPLRGIASFASFLEEDYKDKLDEEGQDYIKEIRGGTHRMSELIEDLLTLSRISRIKNPYEDVNINELLDTVKKRIEFDIKEHKVDLTIHEKIPAITCDRIKMTEVFLNLINNAIKFSSKNDQENPKVVIGYENTGEFHQFYVKDNGIGIDPKYHDQVFGMFKRLHTTEEFEGTGAGLGIVKKIIDDHGGKIWVDSAVGKGCTFYFTIPKNLKVQEKEAAESQVKEDLAAEKSSMKY